MVSTCTACDLQELTPMKVLRPGFNHRKATDDHVTIDITNQEEPDEIKLIVERMTNIDIWNVDFFANKLLLLYM